MDIIKSIQKHYKEKYEDWTIVTGTFRDGYKKCIEDMIKILEEENKNIE